MSTLFVPVLAHPSDGFQCVEYSLILGYRVLTSRVFSGRSGNPTSL